ncbi:hypothetical protein AWN90_36930 [Nocardia terpenica]|uniref:Uncharacterized protein n=1 Tax=Nocardia terpenica TaxID=455432 RepID=A0A164LCR4_9NOCA|nr:hypothetical protein AWN90_36930 [Nocardia terpenica]
MWLVIAIALVITCLLEIAYLAASLKWADRLWRWSRCSEGFTVMLALVWAVQLVAEGLSR